jgi:hypothetical protein
MLRTVVGSLRRTTDGAHKGPLDMNQTREGRKPWTVSPECEDMTQIYTKQCYI